MRTPPAAGTSRRPTTPQRCSAQEQRGASPPAPPRTEPSPPDSPSHPHVPPTSTGLRPPACRRRSPRRSRTPSRNPRHYPWTAHGMRLVADSPDDDRRLLVTVSFRAAGPRPPRRGRPSRGSTPNLGRGGTRDERCPMWAPSRASWPARPSISSPGGGGACRATGTASPSHADAFPGRWASTSSCQGLRHWVLGTEDAVPLVVGIDRLTGKHLSQGPALPWEIHRELAPRVGDDPLPTGSVGRAATHSPLVSSRHCRDTRNGERFFNLSPLRCILPSQRHILCAKEELKLSAVSR